jgi:Tol biopolymer transport system component
MLTAHGRCRALYVVVGLILMSALGMAGGAGAAGVRNGVIAFDRTSYSSRGNSCCTHIYSMRPDGTHLRRLAPKGKPEYHGEYYRSIGFNPVFTPSGDTITFSSHLGLFDMSSTGQDLQRLVTTEEAILGTPSYAPDGSSMINVDLTKNFLFTMTADGSEVERLPGTARLFDPVYAPDGRHVLASKSGGGRTSRLVTMRPDGTAIKPIRHSAGDYNPAYSPDGRFIVYERVLPDHPMGKYREALFEMRSNGSHAHRFGRASSYSVMEPTFSPDGRYIAFASQRRSSGRPAVWIMRVDGKGLHQVTHAGADVASESPTWQARPGN